MVSAVARPGFSVTPFCDDAGMSHIDTTHPAEAAAVEQLALLVEAEVPVKFRLDQRTRERGLAHVAALRAQLAARAARRQPDTSADRAGLLQPAA